MPYQSEYIRRINLVVDYIDQNLQEELLLNKLAKIACFSPFYFQRIFKSFQGESPADFVSRLRLEKAASLLINDEEKPIAEIAFECGFSDPSVFTRNFNNYYKTTPSKFRKNRQSNNKNHQAIVDNENYVCLVNNLKKQGFMKNIEVKEMSALNLVYCRHRGAFNQIGKAYEKLFKWAGPRGLLNNDNWKTVTVYHDDPNITDIENVRQDACITIEDEIKTDGEIGTESLPSGKYAVGRFEIDEKGFDKAWDAVCVWIEENGYQPADGKPYELYHNDHTQHPERKFILDICVPVKAL